MQPTEINEAIQLHKSGDTKRSSEILREYLLKNPSNVDALLWLAKVSPDEREAVAAAELALALQPNNEIARRAVLAVQQRLLSGGHKPSPIDITRITGLTLAQARAVNWPFRKINRPLGVLLEEKVIDIQNLSYAIEKAFDAQLKRAATTLLLVHLLGEGLKDPPPSMKVLDGGSLAARNERLSTLGAGVLLGLTSLLMLVLLASLLAVVILWITGSPWGRVANLFSCLAIISIGPILYVLMNLLDQLTNISENNRAGVKGENAFADELRVSLTSPWMLFRNIVWPERKWGDVDLALVGPGGIWAFEVKAYSSDVRVIGEKWQYKSRFGWRKLSKSPDKQARRNAMNVKDYLDLHGVNVGWVEAVVIWAGEDEKLSITDPATKVWKLSEISTKLEELWQKEKLSTDQVEKAKAILTEVIEIDNAKWKAREEKFK